MSACFAQLRAGVRTRADSCPNANQTSQRNPPAGLFTATQINLCKCDSGPPASATRLALPGGTQNDCLLEDPCSTRIRAQETGQSTAIEKTSAAVRRQANLRGRMSKEVERANVVYPAHVMD